MGGSYAETGLPTHKAPMLCGDRYFVKSQCPYYMVGSSVSTQYFFPKMSNVLQNVGFCPAKKNLEVGKSD